MGRNRFVHLKCQLLGTIQPFGTLLRKNSLVLFAVLVMGLALAACATSSPTAKLATAPAISSPVKPTATETPTVLATHVPTATATATAAPIKPTASPTPALAAACKGAPASVSPDGEWVLCDLKDVDGKSIAFVAGGNGRHWDVNYPKLSGSIPVYGGSRVLVWTPDDRYLYAALVEQMAGGSRAFGSTSDIWRMDLSSGAVKDLLPTGEMPYESWFYDLAVSPDALRLVYINQFQAPLALNILALPGDTKTEIKLADNPVNAASRFTAGELVWTPDGKSLVYKWVTDHSDNPCSYEYSILIMDLQTRSIQTFVPETHVPLCNGVPTEYHVTQVSNQQVTLAQNGVQWVYDLAAKTLTQQGTLTPTP